MLEYTDRVRSSIALHKILDDEAAKNFIGSIYWNYLFNHGLMNYTYLDGNEIPKDVILKQGDKFRVNQPDLQGDDYSIYEVVECDLDTQEKKFIRLVAIDLTAKAPMKAAELTITYNTRDPENENNPSIAYDFQCIPNHNSVVKLTEINNQLMLKRIKRLSEDPENVFKELELISNLIFEYNSDDVRLPHGVNTTVNIPNSIDSIREGINRYKFLCKLFSDIFRDEDLDSNLPINQLNAITVSMPSLSWSMDKTLSNVNFIIEFSDNGLILTSESKVDFFGKVRYEMLFLETNDDLTSIKLAIKYDANTFKSNLASFAGSAINFFKKDSLPDPKLIMKFRARLMLDTFIRHVVEYMREELSLIVEPHVEQKRLSRRLSE